jgi:hypothetical protein
MTQRIDRDLAAIERHLTGVRMTPSQRATAVSAMRTGVLMAEGLMWLRQKLTRIAS